MNMAQVNVANEYGKRYVAFLDLLGFKALVADAEVNEEARKRLTDSLSLLRETLCNNPAIDMRFTYCSDCIIVTTECSQRGLWELLTSVCTLTRNLLQNDVLVRGVMTLGGVLHNPRFIYGTAVNRAICLERDHENGPKGPLVLLSPEVYEDARGYGQPFLAWLEADGPGRYFVHYLRGYAEYHDTPALPGKVVLDDDAARVIHFISRRLVGHTGSALEKAQWFQEYWNRAVAKPGGFAVIENGIVPELPEGPGSVAIRRLVDSGDA
ncbi:MAG: hypothetical protein ABSG26_10785 [Bryobacteraceae bacterium]